MMNMLQVKLAKPSLIVQLRTWVSVFSSKEQSRFLKINKNNNSYVNLSNSKFGLNNCLEKISCATRGHKVTLNHFLLHLLNIYSLFLQDLLRIGLLGRIFRLSLQKLGVYSLQVGVLFAICLKSLWTFIYMHISLSYLLNGVSY